MPIIQTTKQLRPRDKHDHYPTPLELCEHALALLPDTPQYILDPGAGTGVWGFAARCRWLDAIITGVELSPDFACHQDYDYWHTRNYLAKGATDAPHTYDAIIGNPPYRKAEEFIWRSRELLAPDGHLLFLLRLAFLESQKRGNGLWQEFPPKEVRVLIERPSFTGDGKTDATAYALFLWQKGWTGRTTLDWLSWR